MGMREKESLSSPLVYRLTAAGALSAPVQSEIDFFTRRPMTGEH